MKKTEAKQYGRVAHNIHWLFFIGLVASLSVGVYSLRQNNLRALDLRNKVLAADKANGNVESTLKDLRSYIYAHMNTNLSSGPNAIKPPIQLKYTYDRLVKEQVTKIGPTNARVNEEAHRICALGDDKRVVSCLNGYISKHSINADPIPDALYKFDFVSPIWSPDLAGFSLLAAALFATLYIISWTTEKWLRVRLRSQ